MELSWEQVRARRLVRHGLAAPLDAAPAEVVRAMAGAHAQVMVAGEVSVALRTPGARRAEVQAALWEDHTLVKTFGPRGTVHFLPTADLPMWTGALSSLPPHSPFTPDIRLTPDQVEAVLAGIGEALADAELTVDELTEALAGSVGSWSADKVMPAFQDLWPRWRQATALAAHRGLLCFGPNRGRKVTYTSPHRWGAFTPSADGLGGLLRAYLHAYGPARPRDFAQWLSAPPSWATRVFADHADSLQRVEIDGIEGWVVAGDLEMPAEPPRGLRLLPYFDAYAVGSHPRERVYPGPAAARALAGSQAGNFPVLLIDGVVAGVWHQKRSGKRLAVTVEPLRPLSAAHRRGLTAQVDRIADILGGTPDLTVGPVTVGAHA